MRMSITLHRDDPDGAVLAHLGARATACNWTENEHGDQGLTITVPMQAAGAFRVYAAQGLLWVVASSGGRPSWVGLLDEPSLWIEEARSGVTMRAIGRYAALDDLVYTALWSDTQVTRWRPLTNADRSNRLPERWVIDTNNRLFMGLKQGQTYTSSVVAALGYQAPDRSSRSIVAFSADVEHSLTNANWVIRLQRLSGGYGGALTTVQTITGTGALATTTINQTWAAACDALIIDLVLTAGSETHAGEDGARYVRLTNVRVKTTTAASVTADLIVADLAAACDALNGSVLASATPIAASPGLDLTDEIYEDAAPTDVLASLALRGDGAGAVYTAAVDRDGFLTFQERGTGGRTWYVDVDEIELAAARSDLANSIYATYKEAGGRVLRTAANTDAASVTRYGRTRQRALSADTTSAAAADGIRDVALIDGATVPGAASITIRRCAIAGGGPADPAWISPGDTLIVRNLPLMLGGTEIDQLRSFRVGERGYDPIKRRASVTPEARLPRLDVLLSQR